MSLRKSGRGFDFFRKIDNHLWPGNRRKRSRLQLFWNKTGGRLVSDIWTDV